MQTVASYWLHVWCTIYLRKWANRLTFLVHSSTSIPEVAMPKLFYWLFFLPILSLSSEGKLDFLMPFLRTINDRQEVLIGSSPKMARKWPTSFGLSYLWRLTWTLFLQGWHSGPYWSHSDNGFLKLLWPTSIRLRRNVVRFSFGGKR